MLPRRTADRTRTPRFRKGQTHDRLGLEVPAFPHSEMLPDGARSFRTRMAKTCHGVDLASVKLFTYLCEGFH